MRVPFASRYLLFTQIKVDPEQMLALFERLEEKKRELNIGHFEIAHSSLKDVFEKKVGL